MTQTELTRMKVWLLQHTEASYDRNPAYLFLPLSLYMQGDKQKAADYLYGVFKDKADSECEQEKQRMHMADLAEYNRLKEKLGL